MTHWPLVTALIETDTFSFLDQLLAERLLAALNNNDENSALFLCYLSAALRQGHLCIHIDNETISPWLDNVPKELAVPLQNSLLETAAHFPNFLNAIITYQNNRFYWQKYALYETEFQQAFQQIKDATPTLLPNLPYIQTEITALLDTKKLLPEQADALLHATQNNIAIICGGPGTGKTYTAGHFLRLFWESLPHNQKKCSISLAAPTGKAAAALQKSLQTACQSIPNFPPLQAQTLHALLNIRSHSFQRQNTPTKLDCQLLVIDESSMIDLRMMHQLFKALNPGTRIVLLGDPCQLPSIEAGSIFADLAATQETKQLKVCLRTDLKEIVEFAALVNNGLTNEALNFLKNCKQISYREIHREEYAQHLLLKEHFSHIQNTFSPHTSPEEALNRLSENCILTPLRKGPLGVEELNQAFYYKQLALKPSQLIIPIIITSNDYRSQLFNGEVGILYKNDQHSFALFNKNNNTIKIPAPLLPSYEFAYCLSIHKSQGSEYQNVTLLLPETSEKFGREILYTGITRARTTLNLWSNTHTLTSTISKKTLRLSGLVGVPPPHPRQRSSAPLDSF